VGTETGSGGAEGKVVCEREAREERAYEEWAFEVMDDGAPAFGGKPMVAVG
jgi:hypothetical protein